MKYLKTYEQNSNKPKIGDYVLMKTDSKNIDYRNFLKSNAGKIEYIMGNVVYVLYKNIPIKLLKFFNFNTFSQEYYHTFNENKILVFSDNPDDLELKLSANKYNL